MIDITHVADGEDLGFFNTQTTRAGNILSIQVGALEYAQDLGIDLEFFLSDSFRFQNESFKAYLVEVLANQGINVSSLVDTLDSLFEQYTFVIAPDETTTGLIAR